MSTTPESGKQEQSVQRWLKSHAEYIKKIEALRESDNNDGSLDDEWDAAQSHGTELLDEVDTNLISASADLLAAVQATERAVAVAVQLSEAYPDGQTISEQDAKRLDALYIKASELRRAALAKAGAQ